MGRRTKYICMLISANMACLAVGLLVQYYSARAAARRAATEQAWSDVETETRQWLTRLHAGTPDAIPTDSTVLRRAISLMASSRAGRNSVVLVDRRWHVLARVPNDNVPGTKSPTPGGSINWRSAEATPESAAKPVRGSFAAADGPQLAVACSIDGGEGFLIVHQPLAAIEAALTPLLGPLPGINVMTLIWTCVPMCIAVHVILSRLHGQIVNEHRRSGAEVLRQAQTLVRTRDTIIFGLAKLAESRDPETGAHLERISAYSTALAVALRRHPRFHDQITPTFLRLIGISSALHDIGKVGIEDAILLQPGPLSQDQRRRMQNHATIGGQCLQEIEQRLGNSNFLQMAREIAFAHHEHWDGTGYPQGLAGEEIPLAARIVALADRYDALSSRRVYKEAFSLEQCATLIRDSAGAALDPDIVAVWVSIEPKFHEIARRYGAAPPESPGAMEPAPEHAWAAEAAEEDGLLNAPGAVAQEGVLL